MSGFFVAAGFCAHGIAGAGGNGQVMAEWIVGGEPPADLWKMDIRRFGDQYRSRGYALTRTYEVYSTYYDIVYPNHERRAGRPLRLPPAYTRHVGLGAELGEKSGWERVNWYWSNADRAHEDQRPRGWAGQLWSTAIVTEHLACRETAALFDESSFAKIEVTGPGAAAFLQGLCANDVDKRVGSITYTSMLNTRGGIECDFTVTRLEDERFLIVTGTAFGRHDLSWIRSHLPAAAPEAGPVAVRDVTSAMACFGLWGPMARDILTDVCRDDLSFRYLSARPLTVGDVPCVGAAGHLRGRARLGAVPAERVRPAPVGHPDGGRPALRPRPRRLPGHRLAAAGEGLPGLGVGHHERDRPLLGRSRLRRAAREGPLRRLGRRRAPRAGRRPRAPDLPRPRRPALRRARQRAGQGRLGRRRAGHVRRPRLLARPLDRLRVAARPSSPARAPASSSRSSGESVGAEVRKDPLYDAGGERIRA